MRTLSTVSKVSKVSEVSTVSQASTLSKLRGIGTLILILELRIGKGPIPSDYNLVHATGIASLKIRN